MFDWLQHLLPLEINRKFPRPKPQASLHPLRAVPSARSLSEIGFAALQFSQDRRGSGARDSDIAAALSITPHKAARWRARFLSLGLAGLEEDAARPWRPALISAAKIQSVVTKTTQELPPQATHWSTRTLAGPA